MEAIITIVGFLGAGKTTLLKYLINNFSEKGCTQIDAEKEYTYFERTPDGEAFIRPFLMEHP